MTVNIKKAVRSLPRLTCYTKTTTSCAGRAGLQEHVYKRRFVRDWKRTRRKKKRQASWPRAGLCLSRVIAALSAIICVSIFTGGLVDYKKSGGGSGITATGSASCDFESDLIVWRGSFSVHGEYAQGCLRHHQEGRGTGKAVSEGEPGGGGRDDIQFRQHFPDLYIQIR